MLISPRRPSQDSPGRGIAGSLDSRPEVGFIEIGSITGWVPLSKH